MRVVIVFYNLTGDLVNDEETKQANIKSIGGIVMNYAEGPD